MVAMQRFRKKSEDSNVTERFLSNKAAAIITETKIKTLT
jgi:hypothetical protein